MIDVADHGDAAVGVRYSYPYIVGGPSSQDRRVSNLPAQKVVQLVLSTVLKAYKALHA